MKIAVIGAGHMGGAIIRALLAKKVVEPANLFVADSIPERTVGLQTELGVTPMAPEHMVEKADIVILAVRPGDFASLIDGFPKKHLAQPLYLSIAAGRTLAWLEGLLPDARVIRVMPNLGVLVGEGMCGYALGSKASMEDASTAGKLLSSLGHARCLPESLMDAVTALSGSGPAFISAAAEAMIKAGTKLGFPEDVAEEFALQTFLGTATLLSRPNAPKVGEFIKSVATKGGTTAAGMDVLNSSDLCEIYEKTLAAAANRSAEISSL